MQNTASRSPVLDRASLFINDQYTIYIVLNAFYVHFIGHFESTGIVCLIYLSMIKC